MDLSLEQRMAVRALPTDGATDPEILASWARCVRAGLDPAAAPRIPVIEAAELARRRERCEPLRRLAQAEIETLQQQIAGSNFMLAFADADAVVLDLVADNRYAASGPNAGIQAGGCWSEALCGTNGLGTALVADRAVAVTGTEHFFVGLGDISCTAAPIHDAHGRLVGGLDASSYYESRQRHTQALVSMAALRVENALFVQQMRASSCVLAIHPRAEFLGTLGAGLLAFDGAGRLQALSARAAQLLQGLDAAPGSRYEALFGEPYEHLLSRIHRGAELRLRDILGGTLYASCVGHPQVTHAAAPRRAAAPRSEPGAAIEMVDADPEVAQALRLIEAAVRIRAPILLQGETGTGKELAARHAHAASGRGGAFVPVNCAALPPEVFEAELFGYVGGAYTGARREGSAGLIASADGGTLLLDEIGELPLPLQAALLRFLDDQLVRPVGGSAARRVDVQLLAATNTSLDEAVAARSFRADLLYRLATVRVELPPLRLRRDFALAVASVLASLDAAATIDADAVERLRAHPWSGNFRELRAVLTRALLAGAAGRRLCRADLEPLLPAAEPGAGSVLQQQASESVRREFERTGHNISLTSRNLGISRTTVYRHLSGRRAGTGSP